LSPAVSVIIPCFNLGAYLDEAVQSVLDQSYQDFEILIVDDGSDDPVTRHLLASYRRPRTRIIRTENRGVAAARNIGLEAAAGRYLAFLDADDALEPRFLERTVARLDADEALAFAGCWLRTFGEKEWAWQPESCDFPWLLAEDTVCTAAPTSREALLAVGGYDEDERIDGYEDWELAISLVANGFPGTILPEVLFRYRIRPESKSSLRTQPENHARVMEYLVDKHADVYRAHADGVIAAIRRRTAELHDQLPGEPPAAPDVEGSDWRHAILALEAHRRGIEALLVASPASSPPAGEPVDLGSLRRLEPVSRVWGLDRGQPIDRYFIERFLEDNSELIAGDVLEIKDPGYTRRFGGDVRSMTVLDIAEHNEEATLVADLAQPEALPVERYDCILLIQTMHLIFELPQVVGNAHRALAPGGSVLATLPCVSRIDYESGIEGDSWRFTPASARRLFEAEFGEGAVTVESFGNVLTATAFLQGLATSDLSRAELDHSDPYFPLLIGVRAAKPAPERPRTRPRAIEGRLERATCAAITGWVWDREAPEQRLRVDVWAGDRKVGSSWATEWREDLAAAEKAGGRAGFRFAPEPRLHSDPPAEICVKPAGGDPLPGAPRTVECVCDRTASGELAGSALDAPRGDGELSPPWLDVVGWALGRRGPIEAVELAHRGVPFRRVPVQASRPDLADAFPHVPWAGSAGFAERVSLVGTGGRLELEVRALLASGERVPIGGVARAVASPLPERVVVAMDGAQRAGEPASLLRQESPVERVVVLNSRGLTGHPGFAPAGGSWNAALDEPEALVWLCDGGEPVGPDFLAASAAALAERPDASFAVAVDPPPPRRDLIGVLSGTALGCALLFRASSARSVGGIDEGAESVIAAQWDLAVRLFDAGHEWVEVDGVVHERAPTLAERAGEHGARWMYAKHSELFGRHLKEVCLDREAAIGRLLRHNHLMERALESEHRPRLRSRRRERDRLTAKLRRARGAPSGQDERAASTWGDFWRLEPLSPMWGSERGLCIDRYYIERFLERSARDIRGAVLECHDSVYTRRYGGERVTCGDVVDIDATNPHATILTDLSDATVIPAGAYDCLILTQVLQYIGDPASAVAECRRILAPGGVLLATVPCASRIDGASGPIGERWRWTPEGFRRLLTESFDARGVEVRGEGSRNAVLGFLVGIAAEEVGPELLERTDPHAPLVLTARAVVHAPEAAG
jgi:GT2 family glycosyltransferase/SAM-dependent methyltransferase